MDRLIPVGMYQTGRNLKEKSDLFLVVCGYDKVKPDYTAMKTPFSVCCRLSISPSYLCRLFKRFACCSPYHYLARLKMNSAAFSLVSGTQTVRQIGAGLGFDDQYNFSRSFKRQFGVSPGHYRARLQ